MEATLKANFPTKSTALEKFFLSFLGKFLCICLMYGLFLRGFWGLWVASLVSRSRHPPLPISPVGCPHHWPSDVDRRGEPPNHLCHGSGNGFVFFCGWLVVFVFLFISIRILILFNFVLYRLGSLQHVVDIYTIHTVY